MLEDTNWGFTITVTLEGQFRLAPKCRDQFRSTLHASQTASGEAAQVLEVGRAEVGHRAVNVTLGSDHAN